MSDPIERGLEEAGVNLNEMGVPPIVASVLAAMALTVGAVGVGATVIGKGETIARAKQIVRFCWT